jgi:hypothetical protein
VPLAGADLRRDRAGHAVVRFTSDDYSYSFRGLVVYGERAPVNLDGLIAAGKQVTDDLMEGWDGFCVFVAETLYEWVTEGIDDLPNSCHY